MQWITGGTVGAPVLWLAGTVGALFFWRDNDGNDQDQSPSSSKALRMSRESVCAPSATTETELSTWSICNLPRLHCFIGFGARTYLHLEFDGGEDYNLASNSRSTAGIGASVASNSPDCRDDDSAVGNALAQGKPGLRGSVSVLLTAEQSDLVERSSSPP